MWAPKAESWERRRQTLRPQPSPHSGFQNIPATLLGSMQQGEALRSQVAGRRRRVIWGGDWPHPELAGRGRAAPWGPGLGSRVPLLGAQLAWAQGPAQ